MVHPASLDSDERPLPHLEVLGPQVDIAIPVYNEEADLDASVRRLHAYLRHELPFTFRITVADNASTDGTWAIARALESELPEVRAVRLEEKGRGRALHHVWSTSDAAVLAYMDVDLSTDLAAVLPLVAPLVSGHSDMAIGTRLAHGARVVRGAKREVISRCYNLLLRTTLAAGFSDAQCGFKAIRADRARALLPLVQDTAWFFDTELLFLAERVGMRIHEVPVDWVDDPDSPRRPPRHRPRRPEGRRPTGARRGHREPPPGHAARVDLGGAGRGGPARDWSPSWRVSPSWVW